MPKLKVGKKAPVFELPDKNGTPHKLSEVKEDFVVLYFYPRDNTPGCTVEAIEFNNKLNAFKKLKAKIIGISGGDEKSKTTFCKKHKLKVTLLSDSDFKVSKKYGAYGPKVFMGRKFNGIRRMTFVLDKTRKIIEVFSKVDPKTHAQQVKELVAKQLGQG